GWFVNYTTPASRAYAHGNTVVVNITAKDNATKHNDGFLNLTMVIDAQAPTARIDSASPSYRATSRDVLNVSLDSLFTLSASDDDGLPTTVKAIHYSVIGSTTTVEGIYNGPFKITDLPNVYT